MNGLISLGNITKGKTKENSLLRCTRSAGNPVPACQGNAAAIEGMVDGEDEGEADDHDALLNRRGVHIKGEGGSYRGVARMWGQRRVRRSGRGSRGAEEGETDKGSPRAPPLPPTSVVAGIGGGFRECHS